MRKITVTDGRLKGQVFPNYSKLVDKLKVKETVNISVQNGCSFMGIGEVTRENEESYSYPSPMQLMANAV